MPHKVNLPGADELFRATQPPAEETPAVADPAAPAEPAAPLLRQEATGRVRHDEKITVYVSREELLALEQLRLRLRAEYDISVDRGRIVRAALALAIEGVCVDGADAQLVRRLRGDR